MLAQRVRGETVHMPPATTALGSLLGHLRRPNARFQPSNVVWSMFPPLDDSKLRKRARYEVMAERALNDINPWLTLIGREAQQAVA